MPRSRSGTLKMAQKLDNVKTSKEYTAGILDSTGVSEPRLKLLTAVVRTYTQVKRSSHHVHNGPDRLKLAGEMLVELMR